MTVLDHLLRHADMHWGRVHLPCFLALRTFLLTADVGSSLERVAAPAFRLGVLHHVVFDRLRDRLRERDGVGLEILGEDHLLPPIADLMEHWDRGERGVERAAYTEERLHDLDLHFTPDDLKRVHIAPEEMSYTDLKSLVTRLQAGGNRAGKWIVDLAFKIAQPFATVIIVLFGVPFAATRRRGGLVLGFGLSLLVCFVYFGILRSE